MMKSNDWDECVKLGNKGEVYVKEHFLEIFKPILNQYLFSNRFKYNLNNLIETKKQRDGIDGNVSLNLFEYEVKTRSRDYGDILLETVSVRESGKTGWFFYTKADVIVYLIYSNKKFKKGFLILMENARVKFSWQELKKYKTIIAVTNNGEWSTENKAVPYRDFLENSLISLKDCLNKPIKKKKGLMKWC